MKRTVFSYPYIVWMLLFIVAPMLFIVFYAFTDGGAFSLEPIKAALSAGYLKVLGHSALIALYTTCICLLLGYPVAYILSKMKKAVAALVSVFFIVPMWMNFLLRTYAWKVLLGAFAPDLLYTEAAVLIGMVYNFLPFMILPIYTVLQKLDKSYIEAARDLGADGVVTFMRVVLPLSVPGIVSGVTMVFVPSITAFAISQLLGGKMTGMLYGDLIYNKFVIEGSQNVGSALSIVLLISVLVSMGVMKLVDKSHEEEGVSSGEASLEIFTGNLPWDHAALSVCPDILPHNLFLQLIQDPWQLDGLYLRLVCKACHQLHHNRRDMGDCLRGRDFEHSRDRPWHSRRNRHTVHEEASPLPHTGRFTASHGQSGSRHRRVADAALHVRRPQERLCAPSHSPHNLQHPLRSFQRASAPSSKLRYAL